jgi:hypothetical protein
MAWEELGDGTWKMVKVAKMVKIPKMVSERW